MYETHHSSQPQPVRCMGRQQRKVPKEVLEIVGGLALLQSLVVEVAGHHIVVVLGHALMGGVERERATTAVEHRAVVTAGQR